MSLQSIYTSLRMTKRRITMKSIPRMLYAYLFAYTAGLLFFVWNSIWFLTGKLKVVGYGKFLEAVLRGRVIIVSNHPTILESVFLSTLLVPLFPVLAPCLWPFSLPDHRLLPERLRWLYPLIRCITVHRADVRHSVRGLSKIRDLLMDGEVVVIHPEGGRTWKRDVGETDDFVTYGTRRLRPIRTTHVAKLALQTNALILPIYVKFGGGPINTSESLVSFYKRGMTFHVGDMYDPVAVAQSGGVWSLDVVNREMESRILRA